MSKYFAVLEKMSTKEVGAFRKYINANFGSLIKGKERDIIKVFNYYLSLYKKSKESPTIDTAYFYIFNKKHESEKDLKRVYNALSDLYKEVKKFLVQQKVLETDFEQEFLWLHVLEEKKLESQRSLHLKKMLSEKNTKDKSAWHQFNKMKLHHHLYFKNYLTNEVSQIHHPFEGLRALDDFYFALKVKFAVEVKNIESILPHEYPSFFIEPIIEYVQENFSKFSPIVQLYFYTYKLKINSTEVDYQNLRNHLLEKDSCLPVDEKLIALITLINYLVGAIKQGNAALNKDSFELYKYGLNKKLLIVENTINPLQFQNIVNTAAYLGEFRWAKSFIESYQIFLPQVIRDTNITKAFATLAFSEGKYEKAISLFEKIESEEELFALSSRIYIAASMLKLGKEEDLEYYLSAFERFINRKKKQKKLNENNRKAAQNFIKIMRYFLRKELPKTKIESEIKDLKLLFCKSFLLSHCEDYKSIF